MTKERNTRDIISEVVDYIEEHVTEKLTIEQIARQMYLSPAQLQRLFECAFNMPIAEYVRGRKMQMALKMLYETDIRISDIAYDIGYGYESSFIRSFKREFGMTPGEARKNPDPSKLIPKATDH